MKILFASSEVAPFSKSGGLADVASALPKVLVQQGVDIRVVSPYYRQIPQAYQDQIQDVLNFTLEVGPKKVYCGIKTLTLDGVIYYFIDNMSYFDRDSLYGEVDDGERFGFFSMAVIEMMEKIGFIPDIIHANDWHTAMIPALLVDKYHWIEAYRGIRKVFTIHNIRFQGIFPADILPGVFKTGYNILTEDGAKFYDQVNFMKAGINFADRVTTVSPTYKEEIQTPAFGENLDGVLRYNQWKLRGIINGIDTTLNDPAHDPLIPYHFTSSDRAGKQANKAALQKKLALPVRAKTPLIGCVSRLTDQKGFQLVQEKAEELLQGDVQVVILGTGEAEFEHSFSYFEHRYPDKFRALLKFDLALAQQIYAGADLFLMPSAFEPCGLSQLMALRYGTLPIVHETGGLKDTIQPYNKYTGEGNGFSFHGFNGWNLLGTIYRALEVYHEQPEVWQRLVGQAMASEVSWQEPAKAYLALYQELR